MDKSGNNRNRKKAVELRAAKGTMQKARAKAQYRRKIKRMRKIRGAVMGFALVTIGIGGYAMHDLYKTEDKLEEAIRQIDEFSEEMGLNEKDERTEKEKFLDSIKVDTETIQAAEVTGNKEIIDQILEKYNNSFENEEDEITRESIGIVKETPTDGNIYKTTDQNGNTRYIQNGSAGIEDQYGDKEWIEGEDIDNVIAIIDKQNHVSIAGMGIIEGEYVPVEIQQLILNNEYDNPYTKSENYVRLIANEKNYNRLDNAYQRRVQELSEETEMEHY